MSDFTAQIKTQIDRSGLDKLYAELKKKLSVTVDVKYNIPKDLASQIKSVTGAVNAGGGSSSSGSSAINKDIENINRLMNLRKQYNSLLTQRNSSEFGIYRNQISEEMSSYKKKIDAMAYSSFGNKTYAQILKQADEASMMPSASNISISKGLSNYNGKLSYFTNKLNEGYYQAQTAVATAKLSKFAGNGSDNKAISDQIAKVKELTSAVNQQQNAYNQLDTSTIKGQQNAEKFASKLLNSHKELSRETSTLNNMTRTMTGTQAQAVTELDITEKMSKVDAWASTNTKAVKAYGNELNTIRDNMKNATDTTDLKNASQEFNILKNNAAMTGNTGLTFIDNIKSKFAKLSEWFGAQAIIMGVAHGIKAMADNTIALDSAMTDLYKVTDNSKQQYADFLTSAKSSSVAIGTTVTDLVSSTADFARLGNSLQDAYKLAQTATIYSNVGDMGISDATTSIISTMKAFNVQADDSISIVDKFNEVGNRYAISSQGIGTAMLESASSLKAAGNDINQSIGLITAANSVVQDPSKVGKQYCRI